MKVLIAEDDATSRRVLEVLLHKSGYEVEVTRDGAEALSRLRMPGAPDIAILDWMMPEMDGVEVCRQLRAQDPTVPRYLILLTAKGNTEDVVEGLTSGADDYVTKPFDRKELLARLKVGERIITLQKDIIAAREELRILATQDSLTATWNRRVILEHVGQELTRAQRKRASLSLAMADIDHFKRINDNFGHLGGDEVLREVSRRLSASLRPYDAVGRFGGEEFLVVMAECGEGEARSIGERLRACVSERPIQWDNQEIVLTISVGVATAGNTCGLTVENLIRVADDALYRAKSAGRNRVEYLSME